MGGCRGLGEIVQWLEQWNHKTTILFLNLQNTLFQGQDIPMGAKMFPGDKFVVLIKNSSIL